MVGLAASLEALVSGLNRPGAAARVVEIRRVAAERLPEWSHAQFIAARASIDRLIDLGLRAGAVRAARALHLKADGSGRPHMTAQPAAAQRRKLRPGGHFR
jgi:hypothetical protein